MSRWAKLKALEKLPDLRSAPAIRVIVGGPLVGPDTVLLSQHGDVTVCLLGPSRWAAMKVDCSWRLRAPSGEEIAVAMFWGVEIELWDDYTHSSLVKAAMLGAGSATSYQSAPWDTPVPP